MTVSAAIFRRGGPKKEKFGEEPSQQNAEEEDRQELEEKLTEILDVLKAPKTGRDLSAAIWRPEVGAAEVVLARKGTGQSNGFTWDRSHYLHIEEAVFWLDRGDLLLFVEEQAGAEGQAQTRRRLLSQQEAYELMEHCGVCMERYLVFSHLQRSGYLVTRFPSRWVLEADETPGDIWGHGAWAHCSGMAPRKRPAAAADKGTGGAVAQPGCSGDVWRPQLVHQGQAPQGAWSAEAEEAAAAAAAAAGMGASGCTDAGKAPAAGAVAAAAAAAATAVHAPAGGSSKRKAPDAVDDRDQGRPSKSCCAAPGSAHQPAHQQQEPQGAHAAAAPGQSEADAQQAQQQLTQPSQPQQRHRGWWCAADASHPALQGESAPGLWELPRTSVLPMPSEDLPRRFPNLKPFTRMQKERVVGAEPPVAGHLVFDVYKPGSRVARSRRQFPVIMCHVALCSDRVPSLQELWQADSQALERTPIKWASVEDGIITMHDMGPADLTSML